MEAMNNPTQNKTWQCYSPAGKAKFLREGGYLSDCTLIVKDPSQVDDEREFKCHRLTLMSMSPVFEKLMKNDYNDGKKTTLNLTSTKPQYFEKLLNYIYHPDDADKQFQDHSKETIIELLDFSKLYCIPSLHAECLKRYKYILKNSATWQVLNEFEVNCFKDEYQLKELIIQELHSRMLVECDDINCIKKNISAIGPPCPRCAEIRNLKNIVHEFDSLSYLPARAFLEFVKTFKSSLTAKDLFYLVEKNIMMHKPIDEDSFKKWEGITINLNLPTERKNAAKNWYATDNKAEKENRETVVATKSEAAKENMEKAATAKNEAAKEQIEKAATAEKVPIKKATENIAATDDAAKEDQPLKGETVKRRRTSEVVVKMQSSEIGMLHVDAVGCEGKAHHAVSPNAKPTNGHTPPMKIKNKTNNDEISGIDILKEINQNAAEREKIKIARLQEALKDVKPSTVSPRKSANNLIIQRAFISELLNHVDYLSMTADEFCSVAAYSPFLDIHSKFEILLKIHEKTKFHK